MAPKAPSKTVSNPKRLYVKGVVMNYCRSKVNQDENNTIVKLQGVNDKAATEFYLGKRLAYIYKAKTKENGSRFRVMWGRIARPHGTNGAVRAKFTKNLPGKALGAAVRVFLFPSRV